MTDPGHGTTGGPAQGESFDREIDARSVLVFGIALAVVTTVVLLGLWGLLVRWKGERAARDARPSPLAEANAPHLPPEPRLQADPIRDMQALRAREASQLTTYGWVDPRAGIARIPIDRAIDLLLANGLPSASPEPSATPHPKRTHRSRRRS